MATSPNTGTGHLALFREGQSRYFCHTEKHKLSPVVFNREPQRAPRCGCSDKKKWPPVLLYAFPPLPFLPAVLAKVIILKAKVLLVAPDWPRKTWMPDLIALQRESPWRLPVRQDMLSQAQISHPNPGNYRLCKARRCPSRGWENGWTELDYHSAGMPQGSLLFVTYTIIQSIISSEMQVELKKQHNMRKVRRKKITPRLCSLGSTV